MDLGTQRLEHQLTGGEDTTDVRYLKALALQLQIANYSNGGDSQLRPIRPRPEVC